MLISEPMIYLEKMCVRRTSDLEFKKWRSMCITHTCTVQHDMVTCFKAAFIQKRKTNGSYRLIFRKWSLSHTVVLLQDRWACCRLLGALVASWLKEEVEGAFGHSVGCARISLPDCCSDSLSWWEKRVEMISLLSQMHTKLNTGKTKDGKILV